MPAFNIVMRFLHIVSAIALLGGTLAWRFGVIPAVGLLNEETRGISVAISGVAIVILSAILASIRTL